jgi:hypothetical protein
MLTYLAIEAFRAINRIDVDATDSVAIGCYENLDFTVEYLSCMSRDTLVSFVSKENGNAVYRLCCQVME